MVSFLTNPSWRRNFFRDNLNYWLSLQQFYFCSNLKYFRKMLLLHGQPSNHEVIAHNLAYFWRLLGLDMQKVMPLWKRWNKTSNFTCAKWEMECLAEQSSQHFRFCLWYFYDAIFFVLCDHRRKVTTQRPFFRQWFLVRKNSSNSWHAAQKEIT